MRIPGAIQVQFAGFLNDSEAQATFELNGDNLTATLVSPGVSSETIRQFFPAWPVTTAATLQARATGSLPYLDIDVVTTLPRGNTGVLATSPDQPASFSTEARLDLSTGVDLTLVSQLSNLSLDQFHPAWPESNIDALITTQLGYHEDKFTQHSDGYIPATTLYEQQLPELSFTASTEGARTVLDVEIDEPGAPGTVTVQYLDTGELDATVEIPKLTLRNQRRLPTNVSGQASVNGKIKLRGSELTVDADVGASNLATNDFKLGRVAIQARTEQTARQSHGQTRAVHDQRS